MATSGSSAFFALAALHGAHLTHLLQITAQLVDAAADVTAVALQLALTGSARADAAAETAHRLAHTRQTRQNVLVLRQLDLQLALAGARTLRENIEDERRAVEYRATGQLFQIAHLRRRQLVVEQDQTCVVHLGKLLDLFRLALTDKRAGIRAGRAAASSQRPPHRQSPPARAARPSCARPHPDRC